jgi:hypothetical protein
MSRITGKKRAGGMVQSTEHLPTFKCEALSSNPSNTKKKEWKKEGRKKEKKTVRK